jgi:ankyrin repeat protein
LLSLCIIDIEYDGCDVDIFKRLLQVGAEPNQQNPGYDSNLEMTGTTALHIACYFGNIALVSELLLLGGDMSINNVSHTAVYSHSTVTHGLTLIPPL